MNRIQLIYKYYIFNIKCMFLGTVTMSTWCSSFWQQAVKSQTCKELVTLHRGLVHFKVISSFYNREKWWTERSQMLQIRNKPSLLLNFILLHNQKEIQSQVRQNVSREISIAIRWFQKRIPLKYTTSSWENTAIIHKSTVLYKSSSKLYNFLVTCSR